jgi:hypothetical protein
MILSARANKLHPQKSERWKTAAIRSERRRIRLGTSIASTVSMEIRFSAPGIYLTAFGEVHAALTPPVVSISS